MPEPLDLELIREHLALLREVREAHAVAVGKTATTAIEVMQAMEQTDSERHLLDLLAEVERLRDDVEYWRAIANRTF